MNPDVVKYKQFMQQNGGTTKIISPQAIQKSTIVTNSPFILNYQNKDRLQYSDLENSKIITQQNYNSISPSNKKYDTSTNKSQDSPFNQIKITSQSQQANISSNEISSPKQQQVNINDYNSQQFLMEYDTYFFNVYDFNELPELPTRLISNKDFFLVSKHIRKVLKKLNFYYNSDSVESMIQSKILEYNNILMAKQAVYEQNIKEKEQIYEDLSVKFRHPRDKIQDSQRFECYDALLEDGLKSGIIQNYVTFKDKIFPNHLIKDEELDSSTLEAMMSLYQSNFPGKLFVIPPDYLYSSQLQQKVRNQAKQFLQYAYINTQDYSSKQAIKFAMVFDSSGENQIDVSKLQNIQKTTCDAGDKIYNDIVMFYPFCENNHWSALLYSSRENSIYIIDSLFKKSEKDVEQYIKVIQDLLSTANIQDDITKDFCLSQSVNDISKPHVLRLKSSKQDNSFDCGLCLLYILHTFLLLPDMAKIKIEFTKLDIANYRFYFLQYFLWHCHIEQQSEEQIKCDNLSDGIYDISSSTSDEDI